MTSKVFSVEPLTKEIEVRNHDTNGYINNTTSFQISQ